MGDGMTPDIDYSSKPTSDLTDDELDQCSSLYSHHYGVYSPDAPEGKAGKRVRMSSNYYRSNFMNDNYRVVLAKHGKTVVGQAFYLRDKIDDDTFTWVLQLVVHTDYRRSGIGGRLLHSIWGFSDDGAWGLATANPFTVKTLEGATLRHVLPEEIMKHEGLVCEICSRIPYISELMINGTTSMACTDFYVNADGMDRELLLDKFGDSWILGSLPSGHEWVAFTFEDQDFDSDFTKELCGMIDFSEERLKDAYSRMDMENHPWAKHTSSEIRALESMNVPLDDVRVLDAGCGRGRHSLDIAHHHPSSSITGVDFSKANIEYADSKKGSLGNASFEVVDLRNYHPTEPFDVVLCLYDVVGSFPDDVDNDAILDSLASCCKIGGHLVISVMNMELTRHIALPSHIGDVQSNPKMLFDLPPGDVMHKSGDVFDPKLFLIDSKTGLVYRKEQFGDDSSLPAEYVIRDRRYTAKELTDLVKNHGFDVIDCRYVRAGRWDEPLEATDLKAKEILLIARKMA